MALDGERIEASIEKSHKGSYQTIFNVLNTIQLPKGIE
jgi:hypothetical protein